MLYNTTNVKNMHLMCWVPQLFFSLKTLSPWWPSCCLDRGALINVEAPGCGTSVVQGPTGHKEEGFHPGVQLLNVPTFRRIHKSLKRVLIKEAILV